MKQQSKELTAIVTGGNSGLGLATAHKFVAHGILTYIVGRTEEKLESARKELGTNARIKMLDLSDLEKIPQAIKDIYSETGSIDILVNNAGINMKKPLTEVTDEEFALILRTNIQSVFAISREVVPFMKNGGSIVNISSMAAHYGLPEVIAYTASKSAIEGMTRAMAVELAGRNIRVNCVAPGFIDTPMSRKALNGDTSRKDRVMSRTPMGRLGVPEDVADAVQYLVSDAAKYVTGTILKVDGGNSIGF